MTTYSTSVLSYSRSTGSLLLAINSAVNSLSRVGMGILADKLGRQNTMVASVRSMILLSRRELLTIIFAIGISICGFCVRVVV